MPDENRLAVAHGPGPRAILLFDTAGTLVEEVTLALPASAFGALAYVEQVQRFVVTIGASPTALQFLSRAGALVSALDLAPLDPSPIRALASFEQAGEPRLLVSWASGWSAVIDLAGNELLRFDHRATLGVLAVLDSEAVTSGPWAGALAMIDVGDQSLVVFALP